MGAFLQEVQPIDAYEVILTHPFSSYDRQMISLFYQPLIGPEAINLFYLLWADGETAEQKPFTHYHLMVQLSCALPKIFEARIALEGIGLLRTYQKEEGQERRFLYELSPPLHAKAFLEDPILSTFLFSKIGEQAYRELRARFQKKMIRYDDYREVSRTFEDVYATDQQMAAWKKPPQLQEESRYSGKESPQAIKIALDRFDFEFLQAGLSEQMIPRKALAMVSKQFIAKTAFLYHFDELAMQKVLMMALDEQLHLSEDRIRRSAAEYYKLTVSKTPPNLQQIAQTTVPTSSLVTSQSEEDQLLHYLEVTPPIDMLRELKGNEPMSVDVQLADKLIQVHGLSVGVVNVLLQYVHFRNDGKITQSFVERIASHWQSKKINTAKEAMEFSRIEHDQYMKWKREGSSTQSSKRKKEAVPEWFKQLKSEEEKKSTESSEEPKEIEKEIDLEKEQRKRELKQALLEMEKGVK